MTVRRYSSVSQETTLALALSNVATTMTVISAAGLLGSVTPAVGETFTVAIDPDTSQEEIVDVIFPSSPSSSTLTITRNVEPGSSGISHSVGAKVRHMAIGRDFREANNHIENSTTAHGLTIANVLETTDTNMITNAMLQSNSVTTAKITDLNVTTAKIADSAITSAKIADLGVATGDIADLAITTGKVADAAITSAKIADLTIATGDIADSAITSAKIADGTIVAGDIADGAVTSAKILNDTIVNADINSAAAIAYSKLNLAGSITSSDITDGTIVNGDISPSAAIAYSKLNLAGSVTSSDIVDGTIVNADLSTSAQVAYSKLNLTNTIVNADINASAAIEKTKISGTAITAADTGTITSTMIADGAITNADINASAAIALSKLATDPLARANHTGTQTASTVSDFDTQVRTSRLDQMAAPTGSVSANSQKITNLATPTSNTDAATKAYADLMIPLTQKGAANGVAELDADGLLPANRLPSLSITTTQVVATQAAMLALTAQTGDVAVRTDLNKTFILTASPATTLANWQELLTPTDAVLSVDGQTGTVSLSSTYATVANAANKLPLAGGTMSGAIAMGSNKITGLGTPTTTGDAATKDYADTKLALTGGTLSGALAMGTNKITGVGDPTNAQDAATKNYIDNTVLAPSNLIGVITSVGNATSIASQTGTGTKFVVDTSPTLVTPVLGVATATSINGTTIPTSKTLVATDSTTLLVPSQTGNSGKYLTTDGTTSSWGTVAGYNAPTLGSTSIASGATVTNVNGLTINSTTIPTSKTLVTTDTTAYVSTAGGSTVTASAIGVVPLTLKGASGQTSDLLSIQNNGGTPLVEVDSAGRLLIGVATSNGAKLEIVNTGADAIAVVRSTVATASATFEAQGNDFYSTPSYRGTAIAQYGASASGTTAGLTNVSLGILRFQNTSAGLIFTNGGVPLVFGTTATERMRIDSSGNVGIGTTSPTASTRLTLSDTNSIKLALTGGSTQNGIVFNAVSTSNQYYVGAGINLLVGGDKGFLIYNTATATAKFIAEDVNGETRTLATTYLTHHTNGVERMRIDSAGNVGINNISPALKLVVTGTGTSAAMPTLGTASGVSYISASTGTYGLLTGVNYSTGDVWMQAQRTDSNATPYNILLNPSGGNVGIGGNAAPARLHTVLTGSYSSGGVWGTNTAVFATGTSNVSGALAISYDDTNGAKFTSLVPGVAWKPLTINAQSTQINYSGTNFGMILNTAGYVGIGAASPSSRLTVGANPPQAGAIAAVASNGGISLALSDNINNSLYVRHPSGAVLIGTDPGGGFRLATNGSTAAETKLSIDTGGTATFTGTVVAPAFTGYITGTNHGRINTGVIFQPAANSQATYSNYPVGYSAMLIPSANGMPNSSHYFYFMKIAQRDNGTGWSGIAINFNNGDFYVGTTMDGTTYATWKRMANEILMGTAAPSGGVDGDVYVQYV